VENLHLHLEYLLRRHECVTVPGLGAFIVTEKPARFDFENGKILPPCREISFNSALRHDDGLLASSYARKESVSFEEGRLMANRAVERFTALIRKERGAAVGNVGQLTIGDEDRLTFTPWLTADERSRLLGMEPLELRRPTNGDVMRADVAEQVADSEGSPEKKTAESEPTNKKYDKYYHFKIRKHLVHGVAAAMLVALVAISVLIPVNHSDRGHEYASVVPVESLIRKTHTPAPIDNRRSDVSSPRPTESVAASSTDAAKSSSVAADQTAATDEQNNVLSDYYLIVATFRTRNEADDFISQHRGSRWSLECVSGKKLFRVAADSSNDRNELQKKLNDKSLKQEFEGAWVWKR